MCIRDRYKSTFYFTLLYIFPTKACIVNRKKLVKQQYVLQMSRCPHPHNMVNFSQLASEIVLLVWAHYQISTAFASWQRYCTTCSSGRQPSFAALNRGRHLRSAGRPSRWTLAHISSSTCFDRRYRSHCPRYPPFSQ